MVFPSGMGCRIPLGSWAERAGSVVLNVVKYGGILVGIEKTIPSGYDPRARNMQLSAS